MSKLKGFDRQGIQIVKAGPFWWLYADLFWLPQGKVYIALLKHLLFIILDTVHIEKSVLGKSMQVQSSVTTIQVTAPYSAGIWAAAARAPAITTATRTMYGQVRLAAVTTITTTWIAAHSIRIRTLVPAPVVCVKNLDLNTFNPIKPH